MSSPNTPDSLRILCVDDEPSLRDVLVLALRQRGHTVAAAEDGLQAWHMLTDPNQRFDVVITDNQMPNMDGVQLAEKLRSAGFPGGIVFFSSTVDATRHQRIASLAIDAIVEKGRPISDLLVALQAIKRLPE